MRTTYSLHTKQGCLDEPPPRDEEYTDDVLSLLEDDSRPRGDETAFAGDDTADDVLSLLEENARLRGLVIKLSNLILKNVADGR